MSDDTEYLSSGEIDLREQLQYLQNKVWFLIKIMTSVAIITLFAFICMIFISSVYLWAVSVGIVGFTILIGDLAIVLNRSKHYYDDEE